jgi:hypothetical protein
LSGIKGLRCSLIGGSFFVHRFEILELVRQGLVIFYLKK